MKRTKSQWPKELRPVLERSATSVRNQLVEAFDGWKSSFLETAAIEYGIEVETASEIVETIEWTLHNSLSWALLPKSECRNTDYLNSWREHVRSADSRVFFSGRGRTTACYPVFKQADIEAVFDDSLPSMVFPDETEDKDYPVKFDP